MWYSGTYGNTKDVVPVVVGESEALVIDFLSSCRAVHSGGPGMSSVGSMCYCWLTTPTTTALLGALLATPRQQLLLRQHLPIWQTAQTQLHSSSSCRRLWYSGWGHTTMAACQCGSSTAQLCARSLVQPVAAAPPTAHRAPVSWQNTRGWTLMQQRGLLLLLYLLVAMGATMGCLWCCQQCLPQWVRGPCMWLLHAARCVCHSKCQRDAERSHAAGRVVWQLTCVIEVILCTAYCWPNSTVEQ